MAIASGLGATWGFASEATVGTFVAPTHFITFTKESMKFKKNVVQSKALHGGLYLLGSRRAQVTHAALGTVNCELYDRQMGPVFKQMLGANTAPALASGVYTTVFTPADTTGQSLSLQFGIPTTAGASQSFSYAGSKVTDWTLSVTNTSLVDLEFGFDSWNEDITQTYTAASYLASDVLHFAEGTLTLGGTATTSSGVTSVSGGTQLAVAKAVTIKCANKYAIDRYFIGSAGTKAEQLSNDFRDITGSVMLEFENTTDVLAAYYADTPLTLQLSFQGPIVTGSSHSSVSIIIPQIRWEGESPDVDGPGVITYTAPFTGLDDGVNNQIQLTSVSLDSTL